MFNMMPHAYDQEELAGIAFEIAHRKSTLGQQ
jgi:hypothetical protein